MTDTPGLLALMQVSDSLFPSGMFTHSLGLEQMAREGAVRTADDIERFVGTVIERSVATSDAVACAQSVRHTERLDIDALVTLDRSLFAMKTASELRAASTGVGRRLLEEVAMHHRSPVVVEMMDRVRSDLTPGTHPVAFGVVAASFAVDAESASASLMQGTANAILQAAMRLLPVSHRDVQASLHRLRPLIAAWAVQAAAPGRELESFHPLQDIAAMRHETAPVRMFAS